MKTKQDVHRETREELLTGITGTLAMDERLVAGWLTGSYARGDTDALSDIDITIVAADPYSEQLCRRLEQVSSQTSPERYALFSQFGTPALIHENNNNAPDGGTFTFVLYAESALVVDWTLIPQSKAVRPLQSKRLFDKINIPVAPPPEPATLEQSKKALSEMWAFFWMMAAVTIKYILRGDGVFAAHRIESLHGMIGEIERHLDRQPAHYTRGSLSSLQPTSEKQLESTRELCNRMLALKDKVSEFTGAEPLTPVTEIEELLTLAQPTNHQSKITNLKS
jgi:predicted nucleotidyltransferase